MNRPIEVFFQSGRKDLVIATEEMDVVFNEFVKAGSTNNIMVLHGEEPARQAVRDFVVTAGRRPVSVEWQEDLG